MNSIATPYELREFLKLLKAWGAPEHLISLDLHMEADAPVEMTCRFYAVNGDGEQIIVGDAFVQESKRYRLVPVEDDEAQP